MRLKRTVSKDLIAKVEADIGPVEVLVYNLGSQVGNRDLAEPTIKRSRWAGVWRHLVCSGLRRLPVP